MVLLSHNMTPYPRNFSCELVVHTPVENARIMMKIEEFYIPSKTPNCVENYLYVFDSNTAKSKAMTEAGGERGLCGPDYPKNLIFTSRSYICIAFHTSSQRPLILPGMKPGFRVILTAIQETRNNSCPSDNFYCGPVPLFMGSHSMMTSNSLSADSRLYGSFLSLPQNIRHLDERFSTYDDKQYLGYCITKKSLCDGIVNCEDRKDEEISRCQAFIEMKDSKSPLLTVSDASDINNWLSGFLSLGVPASIAIAVSTIVIFTLGIGVVICCCHRCCRMNQTYNNQYSDHRLAFRNDGIFYDTFNRPISTTNNNFDYSRSQHLDIISVNAGVQSQLSDRINLISHADGDQQNIARNWPQTVSFSSDILISGRESCSQQRNHNMPVQRYQTLNQYLTSPQNMTQEKEAQSYCFIQTPLKLPLIDRHYPLLNLSIETIGPQYFVSVSRHGSDSYSSVNTNSARVYDHFQNGPPGPPPALIHGALDSPCIYRRDQLCCYTPPPYGACNVPPGSSVTASSSRTGTTSGGPRESLNSGRDHSAPAMGQITSGNGSCIEISNQQIDGEESALHTNTPIETISHGGDLSLNGGIVYLGNMYRPLSPQNSSLFQGENCGHGSVTSSGSSYDRKSHQYFRREIKSHHDNAHTYLRRNPHQHSTYDSFKNSSRRLRTSHHQHHHHLKHRRSADPNHTISSGSHTSVSSRSGVLSNPLQSACDVHEQSLGQCPISTVTSSSNTTGTSNHQPIVFPVQL
ncbi:unnamed protein product [Schistosoma turkestanicum]|nr:unnamed protein product [Schistosoma turkestanicum]